MTEKKPESPTSVSPRWNHTTKLVVALTLVAIVAGLLIRFKFILGPLLIAFLLAYLLYPLANLLHRRVNIGWRLSAAIVFLILFLVFLGLLTWGGFAVVDQGQNLVRFLQNQIRDIPKRITELTSKPIEFGFLYLDFTTLDLTSITNQLLSLVQPILSNTASVLGSIATGTATTIGWVLFSMLVGYFILADSGGERFAILRMNIPGSSADTIRMRIELGHIWNAFLRGQILIFFITVLLYIALLGSLGVSFYVGLAFIAGLARFVPYVGPAIAWITYGLVALLQGTTIFGLKPFPYALIVVGVAWLTDIIMDNIVVPRLMGETLKVHPAAVMVAAIVFANLFGVIGVILAAPVLATAKLVFTYVVRKMFDLDPWEGVETWSAGRQTLTFKRMHALANWAYFQLRKFWAWLTARWRKEAPRILDQSKQVADTIREKASQVATKLVEINPGGGSDERDDGTKDGYDC